MKKLFLLLMLFSSLSFADITINPQERADFTLEWQHPTEYTDNSSLPYANIQSTVIQQSIDGETWTEIASVITDDAVVETDEITLMTAPLGEGVYHYRVLTVVVGNLISDPSNIQRVTLHIPKPSMAPTLMVR